MTNFNSNNNTIQSRTETYNDLMNRLNEFYKEPAIKLMEHLRIKHGYTLGEIADIVGFSKQAISTTYLPSEQNANSISNNIKNQGKKAKR